MSARKHGRARRSRWIIAGGIVSAGAGVAGLVGAAPAHAQTGPSATFALGVLTIVGDGADNALTVSRNAAGAILVNGGAIWSSAATPTVANTQPITVLGLGRQRHPHPRRDERRAAAGERSSAAPATTS